MHIGSEREDDTRSLADDRRSDVRGQRTAGRHPPAGRNRTVARLAKAVHERDPACEREAESIAATVAESPAGRHDDLTVSARPTATGGLAAARTVQSGGVLDGGRPLDPDRRARFERRFGTDFGDVRVHDDADAAALADRFDAAAVTVGTDVALGAGVDDARPGLLAEELAHVEQQRHSGRTAVMCRKHRPPSRHNKARNRKRKARRKAARRRLGAVGEDAPVSSTGHGSTSLWDSARALVGSQCSRARLATLVSKLERLRSPPLGLSLLARGGASISFVRDMSVTTLQRLVDTAPNALLTELPRLYALDGIDATRAAAFVHDLATLRHDHDLSESVHVVLTGQRTNVRGAVYELYVANRFVGPDRIHGIGERFAATRYQDLTPAQLAWLKAAVPFVREGSDRERERTIRTALQTQDGHAKELEIDVLDIDGAYVEAKHGLIEYRNVLSKLIRYLATYATVRQRVGGGATTPRMVIVSPQDGRPDAVETVCEHSDHLEFHTLPYDT